MNAKVTKVGPRASIRSKVGAELTGKIKPVKALKGITIMPSALRPSPAGAALARAIAKR
jgi:hypothetical protein